VDSLNDSRDAVDSARFLASRFSCVVSISGERDFITDGQTVLMVEGGSPLMPLVTGMGCSASAVTGAYAACATPLVAAAASMAVFASAGEKAAAKAAGPGTFLPHFLDDLYAVDAEDAAGRVKVVA
jgi:hydroxyethylthiazole kinase